MENFSQIFSSLARESRLKECFCADDRCSSSIIKAHSVQNNRILRQIADNGYVIQLQHGNIDDGFVIQPKLVGRKIATVSTNFCGFHDTTIFLSIESRDYKKNNKEQEFLFAYRAFAREYHVKHEATNLLRNAKKIPNVNRDYLEYSLQGSQLTLKQMAREKNWWNNSLKKQDFDAIGTFVIELHGKYEIAVSSAFAMEYDLQGNKINDFSDLDRDLKFSFLTVFPQGNKTFILLSFYQQDKRLFSFINNQIKKRSVAEQKHIVSNLILSHVENLVLSPRTWSSFTKEKQDFVKEFFSTTVNSFDNNLSNLKDINLFV